MVGWKFPVNQLNILFRGFLITVVYSLLELEIRNLNLFCWCFYLWLISIFYVSSSTQRKKNRFDIIKTPEKRFKFLISNSSNDINNCDSKTPKESLSCVVTLVLLKLNVQYYEYLRTKGSFLLSCCTFCCLAAGAVGD